jgi:AcrR family transcriptional regulator
VRRADLFSRNPLNPLTNSVDATPLDPYVPSVMETVLAAPPLPHKGRPREFCVDTALAAALRVFWSKGYEGASMAELTEAMGITKPSLYAAFGNKEQLFRRALDLYESEKMAYMGLALAAPTSREVVERLMRGAVENMTNSCGPRGCLGVISSVACGAEAESIRAEVVVRAQSSHRAMADRLARAQAEGDLPAKVDIAGLTSFIFCVLQGMAVQAGNGATREELLRLVETALHAWPTSEKCG